MIGKCARKPAAVIIRFYLFALLLLWQWLVGCRFCFFADVVTVTVQLLSFLRLILLFFIPSSVHHACSRWGSIDNAAFGKIIDFGHLAAISVCFIQCVIVFLAFDQKCAKENGRTVYLSSAQHTSLYI